MTINIIGVKRFVFVLVCPPIPDMIFNGADFMPTNLKGMKYFILGIACVFYLNYLFTTLIGLPSLKPFKLSTAYPLVCLDSWCPGNMA